jgi:hypothetical protein
MPVYEVQTPGGRVLTIEAADDKAAIATADEWHAKNSKPADESILGALRHGTAGMVEGVGKTLKHYTGATDAGATAEALGKSGEPANYKSAQDRVNNPEKGDVTVGGYGVGSIPRALVEGAPGLATDIMAAKAASLVGSKAAGARGAALAGLGGFLSSFAARNLGSNAEERAAKRTGDANAAPTTEDKLYGAGTTALEGALGTVGASRLIKPASVASVGAKGVAAIRRTCRGECRARGRLQRSPRCSGSSRRLHQHTGWRGR